MSDILLHEQTASHLTRFVGQPSHALMLVGASGGGKRYAAEHIAQQLLNLQTPEDLYGYPYFKSVLPEKDKSTIGIEAVRELLQFVKLKLPSSLDNTTGIRRIVLITDAHMLTGEAQNAILKMLEEPPVQTLFLLTAASGQALLPTIRSRAQQVIILPPLQRDVVTYFEGHGFEAKAVQQAYMMSGGLPGLLHALLEDEDHPLKASVLTARKLLQSTQFERLCLVDELSKKKPEALQVLFVLQHMARAATTQSARVTDGSADKRIRQWYKVQKAAYDAEKAYAVSGQAKLTLTNLMLAL
jgi:hypothetical protein